MARFVGELHGTRIDEWLNVQTLVDPCSGRDSLVDAGQASDCACAPLLMMSGTENGEHVLRVFRKCVRGRRCDLQCSVPRYIGGVQRRL